MHVVHVLVTVPPLLYAGTQGRDGWGALLEGWTVRWGRLHEWVGEEGPHTHKPAGHSPPSVVAHQARCSDPQGWANPGRLPTLEELDGCGHMGVAGLSPGPRLVLCPEAFHLSPRGPSPGPTHRACWPPHSLRRSHSGPAAPGSGPHPLCGLGRDRHRCGPQRTCGPAPAHWGGVGRHSQNHERWGPLQPCPPWAPQDWS